jgi:glycosyltransferase involved in cell wall biosynthesis
MKISYAITVSVETVEIKRLINLILSHKREQDEICVLLDKPKASNELIDILYKYSSNDNITLKESSFNGNFAEWKNELTRMCKGDWIFNIDADEMPNEYLFELLPELIELNPNLDLVYVPRINTLDGDTNEIQKYVMSQGWKIDNKGWINYPDLQGRVFRNDESIKWEGRVHEKIIGTKSHSILPLEERFSIYHPKSLDKQIKQNELYKQI